MLWQVANCSIFTCTAAIEGGKTKTDKTDRKTKEQSKENETKKISWGEKYIV
jgi:hypothetical protein